jgi:hypothetical protein
MEGMYRIGETTVVIDHDSVTTCYDDGSSVYACPDGTPLQDAIAKSLGYGEGPEALAAMTRDHDTLHTLVASARGWGKSKTLHAVAHHAETGKYAPKEITDDEEAIVMLIQRLLNVGLAEVLEQDHAL